MHHDRRDGDVDPGERRPQTATANLIPTPRTVCRNLGSAALSPSFRRSQYRCTSIVWSSPIEG